MKRTRTFPLGQVPVTRREFLRTAALAGLGATLAAAPLRWAGAAQEDGWRVLRAAKTPMRMGGEEMPATHVWTYDGDVPGPTLRFRRHERLRVRLDNGLDAPSTIHWHGLRLPNAMDGVPHLTQEAVPPGGSFDYAFELADSGTYWYHPHVRSHEQKGRGLYGALIVEEEQPPPVDRELVWLLDDWRLDGQAQVIEDFGNRHDVAHGGRIGMTVTVNGRLPQPLPVAAGERIRLRLVNVANGRVFRLRFAGHRPQIIATDGHAVTPHEPVGGYVVLGPGMRLDLIVDMEGQVGERFSVHDEAYRGREYELTQLAYELPVKRESPLDAPLALSAADLPEPDLARAEELELVLEGGAMGGRAAMERMMAGGSVWTLNGLASDEHRHQRLFTLALGSSYRMRIRNDTAWPHPMHLHGHVFRVLSRNDVPEAHRPWRDTVLVAPRETLEIAFLADNPGDWLLHCHVLEHHAGGMGVYVRVA
jgi:FtsP/CotA-like multicopper oxidase with cupredoxin domain